MARNENKTFRAVIAHGVKPLNFNMDVDINNFNCSFGHVHEGLLRGTAKQRNVNLTGMLREGVPRVLHSQETHEAHLHDNGNTSSQARWLFFFNG